MKALLLLVGWSVLLVLCWPLAFLVLILFPLVWLIALPFRVAAIVIDAFLAFIKAILFLPARVLSVGGNHHGRCRCA